MLEAAEKWGTPPWELLERAPDVWMERALLWGNAKSERWSRPRSQVGEVRQVGNKRMKRLV